MKRLFLAAGVAALAISMPAAAERGKGNDKGGQSAKVERGGGQKARGAQAQRGSKARASTQRRGGGQMRLASAQGQGNGKAKRAERGGQARSDNRGNRGQANRAERRGQVRSDNRGNRGQANRAERRGQARSDNRGNRGQARVEKRGNGGQARAERRNSQPSVARGPNRNEQRTAARGRDRNDQRIQVRGGDRDIARIRNLDDNRFARRYAERGYPAGFVNGCPPGLAKQNPACMPPGQYRKQVVGQPLSALRNAYSVPTRLRDIYRDTDNYYHRYNDGYLYRVNRQNDLITSLLPLFGAGLTIGQPFPYSFGSPSYQVPSHYQSFYRDSPDDYYRYDNGYVYEIDRDSGLIEDVIPLYDQGYGVGQMLPASYSYYNLPDPYRSYYTDNDDHYYRYAPGAIYQVDRETQLITSIVSLLTGTNSGFAVGQQMPAGYDMYNVPYAYRDRYYDTPDSWYRYSNGHIYQVDPTTRLVTAIVDAIV